MVSLNVTKHNLCYWEPAKEPTRVISEYLLLIANDYLDSMLRDSLVEAFKGMDSFDLCIVEANKILAIAKYCWLLS